MSAESFLDAVDAHCAAATPGSWYVYEWYIWNDERQQVAKTGAMEDADAEFIAAARTDLPRLAAFARAVLDRLDGLIGSTARNGHQPAGWTTDYFEGYVRARQEINEALRHIRAAAAEHLGET